MTRTDGQINENIRLSIFHDGIENSRAILLTYLKIKGVKL